MMQTEPTIQTLSIALQRIADNVMITGRDGVIEYVNPAFETTTGFTAQEAIGQTPRILRSGRHGPEYYHRLWTTILSGKVFRATTTNRKKNGDIFYIDQTITPVFNDQGEVIFFVSVWKDVTERVLSEEKLNYEKRKMEQVLGIEAGLHSILELNKLIDFVVAKTCEVLEARKCTIMFIDHDTGELCVKGYRGVDEPGRGESPLKLGDDFAHLIDRHHKLKGHPRHPASPPCKIDGTLFQSETFLSVPIELKDHLLGMINVSHKEGRYGNSFTDLDLKILLMIVRQVRIAIENARLYRELKYLALIDPLTGLYNYRHCAQTLDYEILRAKRYRRKLSFLMIDVDQFKSYNDRLGHLEGDKLLKAVSKAMQQNLRETDVVCRYAGDEFAVILPETSLIDARKCAETIRAAISTLAGQSAVTVSIGIAESYAHSTRHELIQRADAHLFTAKQNGKNQISG